MKLMRMYRSCYC